MIILCANEKGGVGKTTTAINLGVAYALAGLEVCLVDTDIQGSATAWQRERSAASITPRITVCNMNGRMGQDLIAMANKFDLVIVDAGGRDAIEIRQSALVCDLWLIPMAASHVEMWALKTALELCQSIEEQIGKAPRATVLINKVHPLPTIQDSNELADAINSDELLSKYLPVCPARLCERLSYVRSLGAGQSVIEYEPNGKARAEIESLVAYISAEFAA
ncbi:MAG: AAA family ATPase [Proteobacteria bacterium]|nr:AAA family ATPase [Pseudomonadota bacterium]